MKACINARGRCPSPLLIPALLLSAALLAVVNFGARIKAMGDSRLKRR